ncbi:thiolase family protein, partial [Pseudomonas syringae group genomosp. 7]
VLDHMFLDGLEDAYHPGRLMGTFAEDCAGANRFSREAQDALALASLARAQQAITDGHLDAEDVPVQVKVGKEIRQVTHDEQ